MLAGWVQMRGFRVGLDYDWCLLVVGWIFVGGLVFVGLFGFSGFDLVFWHLLVWLFVVVAEICVVG